MGQPPPAIPGAGVGTAREFARSLSKWLSPPVVAPVIFWVMAGALAGDQRWKVFLVCLVAQTLLPILYLKWAVGRGWIGDVDMSRRTERRLGLPALAAVYLVGCAMVAGIGAPPAILTVCLCSLAVLAGIWAVNLVYKASGHVAGLTAYMTALSLLVQPLHLGLALIPVLSWARVRSGAHTTAQTIWGGALGAGLTAGLYAGVYLPLVGL